MPAIDILTDIFAAPLFTTGPDGRRLFAPSAMTGKRYLLPDAATEARLRTKIATLVGSSIAISLAILAAMLLAFGSPGSWTMPVWLTVTALFVTQFALNQALGRGLAKDLLRAPDAERIGFGRAVITQARAWPLWLCWLELVVAPLVFAGSILGLQEATTAYDYALGAFGIPLSLLMLAYGLAGLIGRRNSQTPA